MRGTAEFGLMAMHPLERARIAVESRGLRIVTAMKHQNEPNNWIGMALILALIVVFALTIRWLGLH